VRADEAECVDCGAVDDLSVDHVVPLAFGGAPYDPANLEVVCPLAFGGAPYDPANLEVVCRRCNSARRPR
jgi:5-methylcytosine-specific restriction endonuclease McrA